MVFKALGCYLCYKNEAQRQIHANMVKCYPSPKALEFTQIPEKHAGASINM